MAVRIGNIAFDCDDVLKVATFWSAVFERRLDNAKNRVHLDLVHHNSWAVDELTALGATVVAEHTLR